MAFLQFIRNLFVTKKTYTANIVYQGKLVGHVWVMGRFSNPCDAIKALTNHNNTQGNLVDIRRVW